MEVLLVNRLYHYALRVRGRIHHRSVECIYQRRISLLNPLHCFVCDVPFLFYFVHYEIYGLSQILQLGSKLCWTPNAFGDVKVGGGKLIA